jgi:hypothetical protein
LGIKFLGEAEAKGGFKGVLDKQSHLIRPPKFLKLGRSYLAQHKTLPTIVTDWRNLGNYTGAAV